MAYPHGQFVWADVSAPDMEVSKEFYCGLFGWTAEDQYDGEHLVYTMFHKDGKAVCGMGPHPPGMEGPALWSAYVGVDDVDAMVQMFEEHGGTIMVPVMDAMGTGRLFFGSDPQGGAIGFWEAGSHIGSGAFREPGFIAWTELMSRDAEGSLAFYQKVLPWTDHVMPMPMGFDYHVMMLGDFSAAGVMAMPDGVPDHVPTYWAVYFEVDDVDAVAARAAELGGSYMNVMDTPAGRMAVVSDPAGGTFQIIKSEMIGD